MTPDLSNGQVVDLAALIPGLAEAVRRETELREAAFWHAPVFLCGVEVRAFSIAHFIHLGAISSPFIRGGHKRAEDLALFLWSVSTAYERAIKRRNWLESVSRRLATRSLWLDRRSFVAKLRKLDWADSLKSIEKYIGEAMMDAPRGEPGVEAGPSYWSWPAAVVFTVSSACNLSVAEILRMPMAQAFQFHRLARKHQNPDAAFCNPSDELRGQWLTEINEARL